MAINALSINVYSINGYWCILYCGYSIGGYWCSLMAITLVGIGGYFIDGY